MTDKIATKAAQAGSSLGFPFAANLARFLDPDDFFLRMPRAATLFKDGFVPKINLIERKKKLIVEAEVPGIEKDDIRLSVADGQLWIEGERHDENETEEEGIVRTESRYGSFRRAVPLPEGVDTSKVKANFKNGMVRIVVPHAAPAKQNKTKIEIT